MLSPIPLSQPSCVHCGSPARTGSEFCCRGCESVHALLKAKGLAHFYTLKERYPLPKARPAVQRERQPAAFDELRGQITARFYLEGIQCLGCLWLLEKLPEIDSRIASAKLDVALQILELKAVDSSVNWGEIGALLSELGYHARPLRESQGETERRQDQRRQLARIGLAAFCAGNIMLLSVSIYSGAGAAWGIPFGWLSFLLALPCLTFSAWPIYRSGFAPLRHGIISVDLAISIALLAGAAMSLWSLASGSEKDLYFDSLTMLTFLLLSSRFLLSRFREAVSKESPCLSYLSAERFRKTHPKNELVGAAAIALDDELELEASQTLPVDALLLAPEAYFDLSLLTGESRPMKFLAGERIDAGAKLCSDAAAVRAAATAMESRLAKIMEQIRAYELGRSPAIALADRIGKAFVGVVLLLAACVVAWRPDAEGLRRALALVIVTCPCVLAFAIPLALTRTMQLAARKGILFLAPEKIEALAAVKELFFDKTGTLTAGTFEVLDWAFLSGNHEEVRGAVFALEAFSPHPIAKSIVRQLKAPTAIPRVEEFAEVPGFGIRGLVNGEPWRVGRAAGIYPAGKTAIGVWRGDDLVARIVLGDALRADTKSCLRSLQALGIGTHLLSGDSAANTAAVAAETGVEFWKGKLLPEDKAELLKNKASCAMIGDGANDAAAFRAAGLGIAVQGAVELSLKNADVVLTKPGIGSVLEAVRFARSALRIVKTNFLVTLAYNVAAGTLAVLGLMEPMWAAILMPLSALSVFALTQWQTRRSSR